MTENCHSLLFLGGLEVFRKNLIIILLFCMFSTVDSQAAAEQINTESLALSSAPRTIKQTKTNITRKIIKLKKKARRTITYKSKPTVVRKPVIIKHSNNSNKITKIYRTTTTIVKKRYTKGSNRVVRTTIVTTKTTTVVTKKVTANVKYNTSLEKIAPLADARVKKAYKDLHFDVTINSKASYGGLFDAKNQNITLREEDSTIYHELGHFVAFIAGNVDTKAAFKAIYKEEKNSLTSIDRVYAAQNPTEFFAECYREYTLNPVVLKKTCPKTYAAIVSALSKVTDSRVAEARRFYSFVWTK